jgi:hypothetical protein
VAGVQQAAAGEAGEQALVAGQGAKQRQRLVAGRLQLVEGLLDGGG